MNQNQKKTDEIDLLELFHELWKHAGVIVLSAAALALVGFLCTQLLMTPQYVSTTKMYVLAADASQGLTNSDLQVGTQLTNDYKELIQSRPVTETVIADLKLMAGDRMMKHEELLGKLSVSNSTDTRVIAISVTDSDPYRASDIANAIRETAAKHIQDVMDVEYVKVVEDANIPTNPSSPSKSKNAILAGLLGGIVAAGVIIVRYLMNDTIQTPEDIEAYLGLSTLGSIPVAEDPAAARKRRKRKKATRQGGAKR